MRFTKICSHPHCNALIKVGDGNYCDKHKTKRVRPEHHRLYHTQRWMRERRRFVVENDICQVCGVSPSTEVHHSKEHNGDYEMFFDRSGWVSICSQCHNKISNEQRWGK